jgi:hypothetical protein
VIRRTLRHLVSVSSLEARIAGLDAQAGQLATVVKESGGLLPPPRHLQIREIRVAGVDAPDFLDSGAGVVGNLEKLVQVGGMLMLSVHGPKHFDHIPKPQRESMSRKGFAYVDTGGTDGLPSFYQTAFHREDYIRSAWSPYVEVLEVRPVAVGRYQDAVVCHRPAGASDLG